MFYNTEFTQFERKIGYPHIFNLLKSNKHNILSYICKIKMFYLHKTKVIKLIQN